MCQSFPSHRTAPPRACQQLNTALALGNKGPATYWNWHVGYPGSPVGEKRREVTLISGLKCLELISPGEEK